MKFLYMFACAASLVMAGPRVTAHAQWFWRGFDRPATAGESYARGSADLVRSAGLATMLTSAAARNFEEARSRFLDNRLKGTETYLEMRRRRREYRDENRRPRPTSEQLFRLAREAAPAPLAPDQLDPVRGTINWPALLQTEAFREQRETLDVLFAQRARSSGRIDWDQFQQIRSLVEEMQETLREKLPDIPPQVFSQSNAFLRQLRHKAQV